MIYMVRRYETEGPIPNAAQEKWLNFARDKAAGWFEGISKGDEAKAIDYAREEAAFKLGKGPKVASDKPIQLGSVAGREFAMTLDKSTVGLVDVRGRAYIQGKLVYVAMAVSNTRGKKLPPEAGRFLDSFVLKGAKSGSIASADPAPEVAAIEGSPHDPELRHHELKPFDSGVSNLGAVQPQVPKTS
jgi:hypothetical protein